MFEYTGKDKPAGMTWRQWHWLRKHRPAELAALIEEARK